MEREILHRLEKALAVSELVVLLEGCSMREERYFGGYRFAPAAWIGQCDVATSGKPTSLRSRLGKDA